ncbi:hypothetical protein [Xanthomonas nasturtii]|nr:hypothetical protein [Xanthomonas nasturtii]WVL55806.1 hypothetical protein M3O54_015605 [Xanthomonas nasturtii]
MLAETAAAKGNPLDPSQTRALKALAAFAARASLDPASLPA